MATATLPAPAVQYSRYMDITSMSSKERARLTMEILNNPPLDPNQLEEADYVLSMLFFQ